MRPAAPTTPADEAPTVRIDPSSGLDATSLRAREVRGLWLGLVGVLIFAMTVPMTRLAVGPAEAPQLPPFFVTAGRAACAALLAAAYLLLVRAPWPARRHWPALAVSALGTVAGFPLFLALALRRVDAMHAAVVTGILPLATALLAALALRQRPSAGFWACALLGCGWVVGYAALQGGGSLVPADGLLLLAVLSGAVGYVAGARVSAELPPEQVICWVLLLSLPATAPLMLATWPSGPVRPAAWLGFGYVTVFSMWLGFFAWYRGLALGGTVRVSQVQLVQPFAALMFAVPVLGERLDAPTVVCALAVIATVFVGRRMPVGRPAAVPPRP
jgi:drug/metabolite transporter (DMT)-like permease